MILRYLVLSILALSLTACNISGSGQKGPFNAGSNVSVSQLNNQAMPIASTTVNSSVTGSQGRFSVDGVQWNGWTEVSVEGTYFDEFTGTNGNGPLSLRAITRKDQRFDTANVHLFSHLAAARIKQRVDNGQTRNQAWRSTQQEMKNLFGLQRVSQNFQRGVEQVSLLEGRGSYRKDNANLLLFTGSFLATGGNATTLQLLADDFADDAQFNGAGAGVFNAIAIKGGATGLLTTLSDNLKNNGANNPPNNGDMPSLPKWVVVDAGDVTPPVISIQGDNPVEIEVGTTYEDAGATATDDVDEVVDVVVVDNSDVIDTSEAGTFTVTYRATDSAGNSSTATRTVNVIAVADTTPPIITVTGLSTLTIVVGTPYVDEGATALDDIDGEVAAPAVDGSDIIDTSEPSTHTVTYRATDIAGNSSTAIRTVIVEEAADTTPPSIILLGDNPDTIEVDVINEVPAPYQDPGYTATDDRDEVVDVMVEGLDTIDRTVLGGSYTITYIASDTAGNTTVEERTVNVVDTTSPIITLTGDNPHTITVDTNEVPTDYQDLGATVEDNYDAELAYSVDVSVVDTGTVGTYTLVYTATDSSGNEAIAVERTVIVNPAPNEAPTVDAGADVGVLINTGITLSGSATDSDGTIETYSWTDQVGTELATTASFEFTPTTIGVHTLTLTVIDDDGATANDSVNVTVTLPDPYQIVFYINPSQVPRNIDRTLFEQGLPLQATIVDGVGSPVLDAVPIFDASAVNLAEVGQYPVIFSYTDSFGREITNTLNVQVTNEAPIAVGQDISVAEDSSNNAITLVGTDANTGDTLIYKVTQPANGILGGTAPNVTYTPNADYSGNDSFTFAVDDGIESSTATVNITVTSVNDLPMANAGADTTVEVSQSVTLSGSGTDSDGTITTYRWTEGGTELATTASLSYTPTTVGAHTLTLIVTDNDGGTATDTVVVTATEVPNVAPTANAGSDISTEVNQSVTLSGSGTDSDGTITGYRWTENGTELATSASFSYTPTTVGNHTLTLTVTDDDGATATDTVLVTATEPLNQPPVVDVGSTSIDLEIHTSITLSGTATDPDGTIVSSGWVVGDQPYVDTIQFSSNSPGVSTLTYAAVDNEGASTSVTVEVNVFTNDTEAPEITLNGDDPQTVLLGAEYQDPGATAVDNQDPNPSCCQVLGAVDPTQPGTYTLTYYAVDGSGNIATETRTVNVVSPDTIPPVITIGSAEVTINQGDVFVDDVTASDNVDGDITANVVTSGSVDSNIPGTYTLFYDVSDSSGNSAITVSREVTVTAPPVAGFNCPATVATESAFSDDFVTNAVDDTPWSVSGPLTVQDIEDAFNAARAKDASSVKGQKLKMPEQTVWDSYSDSEKALFLINSERCAREIRPYEGISPEVVVSPAQTYADFLATNDVFGHEADGRTPWVRLAEDAGVNVGTNADFFGRAENLAFLSAASTGPHPTIHEPVTRSIYGYLYDDKDDTGGTYGHRAFVLATGLVENSGEPNKEGLIGIGKAEVQSVIDNAGTTFNQTKVYSVMNGFDPSAGWDMGGIQTVDLTETDSCLSGYTGSNVENPDGSSSFVCEVDTVIGNSVSGRVTSTTGAELSGVSVQVLQDGVLQSTSTATSRNGGFELDLTPDTEFTLTFTSSDYANQVQSIKTPASGQSINIDVTMIPRGQKQQVLSAGFPIEGSDGAVVQLNGDSFIDSQGNTVLISDGVNVTITPVDVSSPVGVAAFPGEFAGNPEVGDTAVPILSYGTVEYEFTRASDGEVLQYAPGQSALISIPIYTTTYQDGSDISAGDSIPLWSLDEETGIWTQEGSGIVVRSLSEDSPTGLMLSAQVSHFTWWNCDVVMNPANAIVTVNGPESGSALVKARTNADIGGWRPNTVDTVIQVGNSTNPLPIPSNGEVCFWAEIDFTSGNKATTAESCISAAPGSTVNINLSVSGGALNITASPDIDVTAFINVAPLQVKLQPTTAESNVTYEIVTGNLPDGMTLSQIDSTTAVISGVPTVAGLFELDVEGTDSDNNTSILPIAYTVIDSVPPLEIVFSQNPVGVIVGSDPGTFFFESLPLGIIEGVFTTTGQFVASSDSVNYNTDDVDLNTIGTYNLICTYTDETTGTVVSNTLVVNVVPRLIETE